MNLIGIAEHTKYNNYSSTKYSNSSLYCRYILPMVYVDNVLSRMVISEYQYEIDCHTLQIMPVLSSPSATARSIDVFWIFDQ
jgi:hypothetical protein